MNRTGSFTVSSVFYEMFRTFSIYKPQLFKKKGDENDYLFKIG